MVRFATEDGRASKEFDFARLPVARELQIGFAVGFDRSTGPSGTRKSLWSAKGAYWDLLRFAGWLAKLPNPPRTPGELLASHLDGYRLAHQPLNNGFASHYGTLKTALRQMDGLSERVTAKLAEPWPTYVFKNPLHSYSRAEFQRILTAARSDVRAAAKRIRTHRALLERWRAGQVDPAADPRAFRLGCLLDHLDRVGDVPRYQRSPQAPKAWARQFGTVEELVSLLHLPWWEAAAFLVLLIGLTGQNGGTIANAPAVHHRADGGAGGTATAIVELRKPRRGRRRSHMDVPLADLPIWAGPATARSAIAADELHTPFGVYMLLLELSEPARRLADTDRLFVPWVPNGFKVGRGFRIGMVFNMVISWGRRKQLLADPTAPNVEPEPLHVTIPRLRLSFVQHRQQPVAHTDQVLATEYLGRDRGNIVDYQRLVANVLAEQVAKAKASVLLATLSEAEVAQARQQPQLVADQLGVEVVTLKRMLAGDFDTVLAACVNHTGGPYAPPGEPCQASFLLCMDCPCARATPTHLPVQVLVLDALQAHRSELPPLVWAQRFARPHSQLADLLARFPQAMIAAARTAATNADRRLVERFLARELDYR